MPKVVFVSEKKEIDVPAGSNLREEARKAGIAVYAGVDRYLNCRGLGLCGTCRVLVKKGMENLSPKTVMERLNLNAHPLTLFARIGHAAPDDPVDLARSGGFGRLHPRLVYHAGPRGQGTPAALRTGGGARRGPRMDKSAFIA